MSWLWQIIHFCTDNFVVNYVTEAWTSITGFFGSFWGSTPTSPTMPEEVKQTVAETFPPTVEAAAEPLKDLLPAIMPDPIQTSTPIKDVALSPTAIIPEVLNSISTSVENTITASATPQISSVKPEVAESMELKQEPAQLREEARLSTGSTENNNNAPAPAPLPLWSVDLLGSPLTREDIMVIRNTLNQQAMDAISISLFELFSPDSAKDYPTGGAPTFIVTQENLHLFRQNCAAELNRIAKQDFIINKNFFMHIRANEPEAFWGLFDTMRKTPIYQHALVYLKQDTTGYIRWLEKVVKYDIRLSYLRREGLPEETIFQLENIKRVNWLDKSDAPIDTDDQPNRISLMRLKK